MLLKPLTKESNNRLRKMSKHIMIDYNWNMKIIKSNLKILLKIWLKNGELLIKKKNKRSLMNN